MGSVTKKVFFFFFKKRGGCEERERGEGKIQNFNEKINKFLLLNIKLYYTLFTWLEIGEFSMEILRRFRIFLLFQLSYNFMNELKKLTKLCLGFLKMA